MPIHNAFPPQLPIGTVKTITTIESTGMTVHKAQKQDSGNKKPNLFMKLGILFEVVKEGFTEYNGICAMDEQTMEMYTAYRMPTPPKDEPFQDEYPAEDENFMLVDMRWLNQAVTSTKDAFYWVWLFIATVANTLIFAYETPLWSRVLVLAVALGVSWVSLWRIKAKERVFLQRYDYVARMAAIDPESGTTETWWNFERWQKWAVARYDFATKEELTRALMNKELTIVRQGQMEGLILSKATGEEWPLKPVNA